MKPLLVHRADEAYGSNVQAGRADKAALLERFERQTSLPMLVLSLAIVPLLIIPLVWELSPDAETTILAIDWIIWALFFMEYVVRLYLAPRKGVFIRSNKIDLVVIVLPFLRPLRVVRSARGLRLLRAVKATAFLVRALDAGRDVLTRHKLHYALLVTILVVVAGAALVFHFEQGAADANIESFADALWWGATTVTTVGYGDTFPTTPAARGVAVVLMLLGIAVFGLLAGSLASYFTERHEEEQLDPKLEEMAKRLEHIERMLEERNQEDAVSRRPR